MNLKSHFFIAILATVVSGCVGHMPQTADEFRSEAPGAFLGMGSGLSEETRFAVFVVIVSLGLLAMLLYVLFNSRMDMYSVIALSIVLGGGVSNLYDRVVNNGAVVDFMNMGIGGLRTGIFNVADMFILAGFFLLLFHKQPKHQHDE